MTISTDDSIDKFGTEDTVTAGGGTSAVSDGAMAASSDVVSWTNDDDAALAAFILTWQYPTGTIDGKIFIHARSLNINGTLDEPQPTTSNRTGRIGTFDISPGQATTTNTPYKTICRLPNSETSSEYEFYPYNDSGVTMTAGWTMTVIPITSGPHP